MRAYYIGAIIPLVLTLWVRNIKKGKKKGLKVDVEGENGYVIRNYRFTSPVESAWEGVTTLAELFERSCKKHSDMRLLGTRKLIAREMEESDGISFEKLHLGDYEWLSYRQVFETVCNFSSGLVKLGHQKGERAAIFADTREEWFIALQGCFRRNVTVVTICASLDEEALCHSFNERKVSTVICGYKELKKLANVCGQFDTLKHIICMDDEFQSDTSLTSVKSSWKMTSFSDVQKLGQQNPFEPDLPFKEDVAVIMYTSGMPEGVMITHRNVLAAASAVMTVVPGLGKRDVYLAYLPLAHILELAAENIIAALGSSIGYGSPLTLTDTSYKIKEGTKGDATVLSPTLLASVPAILDRVRDGVHRKIDSRGGLSKKLFELAYARRLSAINGSWFGAWGLEKHLWNFLVFRKLRAILGGRIRFILSGDTPLSGDTQRFINICLGAPIGQGYGLTETCAGGTFTEFDDTTVGRVGGPLPCSIVKRYEAMAPIAVGDIIPDGKLYSIDNMSPSDTVSIYSIITGKKVFLVGVSGAFMPDSRWLQAPEVFQKTYSIDSVEEVLFVSVNDPFVMRGWELSYFRNNTRVKFLADTTGAYVTSLGLEIDLTSGGFGVRSRRFGMIIEDRKVVQFRELRRVWRPPFSIFEKPTAITIPRVPIAVGDIIPDGTLTFINRQFQMELVSMHSIVRRKKVLVLGVRGAFFHLCRRFIRTFIGKADDFKLMGVQEILCISVNDPFVVRGWKWAHFKDNGHINFLADPTASYVASLGVAAVLTTLGMRSRRFSMLLDDCRVKVVRVHGPDTDLPFEADELFVDMGGAESREMEI